MNAISDPDLYNGSTLSAPNITKIINAVALILQNQMQDVALIFTLVSYNKN